MNCILLGKHNDDVFIRIELIRTKLLPCLWCIYVTILWLIYSLYRIKKILLKPDRSVIDYFIIHIISIKIIKCLNVSSLGLLKLNTYECYDFYVTITRL